MNTDATGAYRFAIAGAGKFTVKAVRAGFEAKESTAVDVAAGQQAELNLTLSPATIYSDVTVVADNDRLVASRTEVPLRQLPVTVQTVSAETLAQQGVTNLVDAVKNVPNTNSFTACMNTMCSAASALTTWWGRVCCSTGCGSKGTG